MNRFQREVEWIKPHINADIPIHAGKSNITQNNTCRHLGEKLFSSIALRVLETMSRNALFASMKNMSMLVYGEKV